LPGIPGAARAIAAGIKAGAYTGWLSGSGSSVMCVCDRSQGEVVSGAMRAVFTDSNLACEVKVLQVDNVGLRLA
jgi:homoserine kinase